MNKLHAAIFDLDNTLCLTDSLEQIRTSGNPSLLTDDVLAPIHLFKCVPSMLDTLQEKGIKLGIVTNSPRWYVEKILSHFELTQFEVVVTHTDVGAANVKPSPRGIEIAVESLGLTSKNNIIYIGDDYKDFVAAYAANVTPIAPSWGSKKPITQMPAAVLSSKSLLEDSEDFEHMCLIADRCANSSSFNIHKKHLYFAPLNLDGDVIALSRDKIKVVAFGRYFSQKSELTAKCFEDHKLSQDIAAKESNSKFVAPEYWVDLMGHAMSELARFFIKDKSDFDIITVIPSKKGKNPRLENLLRRISKKTNVSSNFIPDLFYFDDGAQSLKTLGGQDKREREIAKSLMLKSKYISLLEGKKVLIIDDILTTGSTFRGAFKLIEEYKPAKTLGLCLAKTVSIFQADKICPKCNRSMRILTNTRTGIHFLSCTGYHEVPKCDYSAPIKVKDCPSCGDIMFKQKQRHKQSYFLSCAAFRKSPQCKYTESV